MKMIRLVNNQTGKTNDVWVWQIGEKVFAVCQNVKETNDAIKWCTNHKLGDKFECDDYSMEIVES